MSTGERTKNIFNLQRVVKGEKKRALPGGEDWEKGCPGGGSTTTEGERDIYYLQKKNRTSLSRGERGEGLQIEKGRALKKRKKIKEKEGVGSFRKALHMGKSYLLPCLEEEITV